MRADDDTIGAGGGGEDSRSPFPERALAIIEAAPMPTAITRAADGLIAYANPACLELFGWQESEFVGRTMVEVGFWARPEGRAAMLAQLAADGVVRDLEQEITTSSGEKRIALTSISRVELDGEPYLIGHMQDITERRRLEDRLRDSEQRIRQITETFQQGFLLRDVDPPVVRYASPAVARIFGVALDDLYRDPLAIQALIHPDDSPALFMAGGAMTAATDFEFRIVRPDGETRWIRTRAEPVAIEDGRLARIAAVSEDVTAERELHEALRASEERFRLLAENSTDVIGRLSHDMRIEYVSPASRAVYGYEPEAMIGRFGWEFVHPDDLAALREDFSAGPDERGVITNTYRVLRGDGDIVWVEAKIRALHDPVSGEVVEFHTIARDVSERLQAEADVRRAMEQADVASVAKSDFLSRMSHELRTPLHAVLGFGELLEHDDLRPQQREQLMQIRKAGRHLLELINEVLDISRIERGELRLSLEPVYVEDVVGETLAMLEPLARARSVSLHAPRPGEHDVHVLADRQRLKQILLNLLSNAVKYNREGGEVRVVRAPTARPAARIEIIDTGIGIAPAHLDRAFAAFERLGAETTDVEGTGLGLALTQRLIEAMGGTIGVESEVGRGTTFWIELPVADAPAVGQPASERAHASAGAAGAVRTVLYIEDNTSNIRLVEGILRMRPEVSLLVAQQGSLGLELAREHRPALVLLDLNLPDVSGDEILRRLRGDPRTAAITVVVVSADATPNQITRMREAGADGYLTKPFEIEDFLAVLDGLPAPGLTEWAPRPAGAPAVEQPLDPSLVDKLRRLYPDSGAAREFVELFLDDSPGRLEAVVAAAGAHDAEAVRGTAHAWRGSCSLTGAHRLVTLLGDIETLAAVGEIPGEPEIAALRRAYGDAQAALRQQFR